MKAKYKIITIEKINNEDFKEYRYILKEVLGESNTSNIGHVYRHYKYVFVNENNEAVNLNLNTYITGYEFEEYWNGMPSGATVDTKILLKENLTGYTDVFILKGIRGKNAVKMLLEVIDECKTINEIRLRIEISELKIKIEELEKVKEKISLKLNKIYDETLDFVKKFKPNMFLVEKIREISKTGMSIDFNNKLIQLEKELDDIDNELNSEE